METPDISTADQTLIDRIAQIRAEIPSPVRLIAVTKTVSVAKMRLAYAAGIRDFGENRVQEALDKQTQLADLTDITWHLIGHLQSNKARSALKIFDWIHSLDSLPLAQRLADLASELDRTPQLCLQVKLRPDPSKSGWELSALKEVLPSLARISTLKICGLMTIPPQESNTEEIIKIFEEARMLLPELNALSSLQLSELSLGMSGDYRLAIRSGSTMIRLGRVLFGDRS
ncbi:MAG: YggS family pyridoxal phosphate-dependent enzyme [Prochlorotrichaceae cyanobacterium]|jgi:pyridoxal phosphate enzyme (YggS family)